MCRKSRDDIPGQIAELHGIKESDYLEFTPIGYERLKSKRHKRGRRNGQNEEKGRFL